YVAISRRTLVMSVLIVPACPSFFFYCYSYHDDLHSFPTRRSSDLGLRDLRAEGGRSPPRTRLHHRLSRGGVAAGPAEGGRPRLGDRKSTRLNSSHVKISYAVFCLKKKKTD